MCVLRIRLLRIIRRDLGIERDLGLRRLRRAARGEEQQQQQLPPGQQQAQYQQQLQRLRLQGLVELRPSIPYAEALREMAEADACMLFQASNCNQQIPAKLYEYLYCRKPVFALTDPAGDTGQLLAELNISPITPLDDKRQIKAALPEYIRRLRQRQVSMPRAEQVMRYSRRTLTQELASLLEPFARGAAAAG